MCSVKKVFLKNCPTAKIENSDLKILEKNFRHFRDFRGFRVFDLAGKTMVFVFQRRNQDFHNI